MKKTLKNLAIIFVIFVGFIIFALSNKVGGFRGFIVSSGSMEPAIGVGSLIITESIRPNTLRKNDVITFTAPIREHEIVTHRIQNIIQKENLTVIKTKGDHNNNVDNWVLAGGGVIGKVLYTIPFLGFLFAFFQTKAGLILFVILPSIYILYSELSLIYKLIKNRRVVNNSSSSLLKISLVLFLSITSVHSSLSMVSSSVTFATNQFTVDQIVLISPTPTCGTNTSVKISGNGSGSDNSVNIDDSCETTVNQNNSSNSNTSIGSTGTSSNVNINQTKSFNNK